MINFFLSFYISGCSSLPSPNPPKIGKMHLAMEIIKKQRCSQCRGLHHPSVLTKNSVEHVSLRLSLEKLHGMGLALNKPRAEQDLKEPAPPEGVR